MLMRAAALFACLCLVPAAHAEEKRLALVLANEDYPTSIGRLSEAHNDAKVMTDSLTRIGFTVTAKIDQNTAETRTVISQFLRSIDAEAADSDDVVVFVYAAMHGAMTEVEGSQRNFLIPAREEIDSAFSLIDRGVRMDALIQGLAGTKAKAVVVVSDACRNELKPAFGRSGNRSFTPERAGPNMLIAYATELGSTTPDDGKFAKVLAAEIDRKGRRASYAMLDTLSAVGRERSWTSQPFMTGGLPDWFCFNGCVADAAKPMTIPVLVPQGARRADGEPVATKDGYLATFDLPKYNVTVNGSQKTYAAGQKPPSNAPIKFIGGDAWAQLAFARYGAEYLIVFNCREVAEGKNCVTEAEAMEFADGLFIAQTN